MGKCEAAYASIGIRIVLSDLLPQINETNFKLIKVMLKDGFIEDDNEFFNGAFQTIQEDMHGNENWEDFKLQFEVRCNEYVDGASLVEKALLLPIKKILSTDRWGYERYGTNGSSRPLDFDLSVDVEKYKDIEKFEIAFLLQQYSG